MSPGPTGAAPRRAAPFVLPPILPQIGAELAVSDAALGTLVSAYAFMVGLCALVAGPVSDRVGRRKILILGGGIVLDAALVVGLRLPEPGTAGLEATPF